MTKPDILFLLHECDRPLDKTGYAARLLKQNWERNGYKVRTTRGVKRKRIADILFVHIDSTRIAEEYLEYIGRYPAAINGAVLDISKDRFSTLMLERTDKYVGRVIVKTKANFGGLPDLRLRRSAGVGTAGHDPQTRSWLNTETLNPYDYPVFASIRAVPGDVWRNPNLIVERFISERNEKGHYVVRNWLFLGDQGFVRSVSSPYHIVKPGSPGRKTYLGRLEEPAPPELQELRKRMDFDYGRFDYVMKDGKPVLFDVNTTPAIADENVSMFSRELLEDLPRGLLSFLP